MTGKMPKETFNQISRGHWEYLSNVYTTSGFSAIKVEAKLLGVHATHLVAKIKQFNKEMIEFIVDYKTDKSIAVCKANGFLQPFAGLYNKSLVNEIENIFSDKSEHINHTNENERKQCKVMSFIKSSEAEIINPEGSIGYTENTFLNINTPKDFEKLMGIINHHQNKM